MIGVVKPLRSRASKEVKEHQKMYCGTCKIIGERYGQTYRMGLNHDLVLAAEVLGMLCGEQSTFEQVKPRKCFTSMHLPDKSRVLFEYIAALHLFWYGVFLEDHQMDEGSRMAGYISDKIAPKTHQATVDLTALGLDMELVKGYLAENRAIEQQYTIKRNGISRERFTAQGSLHGVPDRTAEPTARIIELVLRTGSDLCGIGEYKQDAGAFGYALGKAIYLHDASIDLKKDEKKGRFNPFLVSSEHTGKSTACESSPQRTAFLAARKAWMETLERLQQLPLSPAQRVQISERIQTAMNRLSQASSMGRVCSDIKISASGRPAVTAAASAVIGMTPTVLHAQSSSSEFSECCIGMLCCVFCCCPLIAMAYSVLEGILECICDILCCFSSYR